MLTQVVAAVAAAAASVALAAPSSSLLPELESCASRRVAYVHVNKAGGVSVSAALAKCPALAARMLDGTVDDHKDIHHHSVQEYLNMSMATDGTSAVQARAAWKDGVFSFAVVRNPYERMVSLFYFKVSKCLSKPSSDHCEGAQLPTLDELHAMPEGWQQDPNVTIGMFGDWIDRLDRLYPVGSARNDLFSAGCLSFSRKSDASQAAWLEDFDGGLAVTTVIGLPSLSTVFGPLVAQCMPECGSLKLGHENAIWHPPAADHYTRGHEANARLIERQAARDFAELGFTIGVYSG